jgi:hypothetical protein
LKRKDDSDRQNQPSISVYFKHGASNAVYGRGHPDQLRKTDSLVDNFITGCAIPMSIVESESFKKFITDLDPKYVLPSRQFITYTYLPKVKARTEEVVCKLLSEATYVALTMDTWSDRRCHAYLALTCHTFVRCKPLSFLLSFESFKGSHTGQLIAEEFERVIDKYEIAQKVVFVVTDNAANMRKAFEVLAELRNSSLDNPAATSANANLADDTEFDVLDDETLWNDLNDEESRTIDATVDRVCAVTRLSCFAHTLQLAVKEGIAKIASFPVLAKCSSLATTLHHSNLMKEAFEGKFGCNRTVPKVNATRWNSLFHQLKTVSDLDQALLADLLRESDKTNLLFTQKDLTTLAEIIQVLEPFAEATDWAQGNTGTAGYVVPCILALRRHLTDLQTTVKYVGSMVKTLLEALNTRFAGLLDMLQVQLGPRLAERQDFRCDVYLMAAVLEPSFGFSWLQDHPGDAATKANIKQIITGCSFVLL